MEYLNSLSEENIHSGLEAEDEGSEIALSVIWQGNKLGAAYYEFDTEHLYLMSDQLETAPSFMLLRLLLKQVQPHYIITSNKADEKVIKILNEAYKNKASETSSASYEMTLRPGQVHLLPSIDFVYESCRHHLQNLNLPTMPPNMNDAEKRIYFSSLVDFKSACMVKAAGGLLKFVRKKSLSESLNILGISSFKLQDFVHVDENTYKVLQIFQSERHPSVYKGSAGFKEGLSLYGICNKCKSSIGKKELKRWFLLPTNCVEVIEERQSAIQYFMQSKNCEVLDALQNSLKHIHYVPKIFSRMKSAQASMNDWKALYKTSYHAMLIGEMCRSHASALSIFQEIAAAFSSDLFRVANLLDKVIDFQEYARHNHFAVKPGVDSELDKMKHLYSGLPDFMTQVAHQELQELTGNITQCSVIYLPQLGYLLTIPMTEEMKATKDYSMFNLRFMFVLNDTVHYKSARTRKLDSILGDTLCDIYDKETKIMHKLQNMVLEMKDVFFSAMDLLSKLDCLISLAVVSKEFCWTRPEMVVEGAFEILKARHPLQELCVPAFVPNDVFSGGDTSKIKIVTGPNSSGKSTYLKQVALIAFLAHIGCFVPAQQGSRVPFLDSLFSCIETVESISISLSSFLFSLNELSKCLNYSSSNSLVVIDEFGKHTEGASGLALAASTLQFWIQKGPASPHVFFATHYLAISSYIPESPFISFQTIDMSEGEEELEFFYQLVDGTATSSYAAHTALKAGLSERLVQRSLQITHALKENAAVSLPEDDTFQMKKLNKCLSIYDAFAELDINSDDNIGAFLKFVKELSNV